MSQLLQPWGYPLLLGSWLAKVGNSLFAAKLLSLLIGSLSVIVFYQFVRFVSGREIALGATLLYVLWPFLIDLSAVLASEHQALLTIITAFLFFIKAISEKDPSVYQLVGAAVFFSLSYIIRPASLVAFLASAITYLTLQDEWKSKLRHLVLMLIVFMVVYGIYLRDPHSLAGRRALPKRPIRGSRCRILRRR